MPSFLRIPRERTNDGNWLQETDFLKDLFEIVSDLQVENSCMKRPENILEISEHTVNLYTMS